MPDRAKPDFPVSYCSDVDGVRFAIVDPQDADMTGWRVLLGFTAAFWKEPVREPDEWDDRFTISEFTRSIGWFRAGTNWNGLGYGKLEYPWSALADTSIIRWIPPGSKASD